MHKEDVEIKSKGELLATVPYEYPENLGEAIEVDGEENVFKLYLQKRKSDFQNDERRQRTQTGVPKWMLAALRKMSREELEAKAKELGIEEVVEDEQEEE